MQVTALARDGGKFQGNRFQVPLTGDQIRRVVHENLGTEAVVREAREIGIGWYNTTYRLEFDSDQPTVFLRVAPAEEVQFGSERHMMRNEYCSAPWLRGLSVAVPRTLAADWTHSVIPRDYLIQSLVPGVPAPMKLGDYPKDLWHGYFTQLGRLTAEVHGIARSVTFGRVIGPHHASLFEWVRASLTEIVSDVEQCGLDANDLRSLLQLLPRLAGHFDDVTTATLLTGDMWTVNVLLDPDADVPTIIGAVDFDRTEWGDPLAEFAIRMARRRSEFDLAAFWAGYGTRPDLAPHATVRLLVHEIRHAAAGRLECHRIGDSAGVTDSYGRIGRALADVIAMA